MDWLEAIKAADVNLFLALNGKHYPALDNVMWFASHRFTWIPLYAYLLYLCYISNPKKLWLLLVCIVLTVVATDQLSVIIKNFTERPRPCHNPAINNILFLLDECGGRYGFVSSHAANTFGLSLLLSWYLKNRYKYFPIFIFTWACFVSYSRIYKGVHYPLDIICGALLGMIIAFLGILLYKKLANRK